MLALMAMMALVVFAPAAIAQDDDVNGMDDDVAGMDDDANGVDDDNGLNEDDSVAVPQQSGAGAGAQYDDDDDGVATPGGGGVSALPDTGGPALLLPVVGALLALGAASFGIGAVAKRRR